jgi:hypothetical protein
MMPSTRSTLPSALDDPGGFTPIGRQIQTRMMRQCDFDHPRSAQYERAREKQIPISRKEQKKLQTPKTFLYEHQNL